MFGWLKKQQKIDMRWAYGALVAYIAMTVVNWLAGQLWLERLGNERGFLDGWRVASGRRYSYGRLDQKQGLGLWCGICLGLCWYTVQTFSG